MKFPCDPHLLSNLRHPAHFVDDATPGDPDITTCSLDNPAAVPPRDHTFTDDQLAWLALADALPRYRRSRAEG